MKNLNEKITEIEEEIYAQYDKQCIPDGIVDVEQYSKEPLKILWILKEPHDKGGQEWEMQDLIKNAGVSGQLNPDLKHTFPSIIYTTSGILHNFVQWDDMDYIKDKPQMIGELQKIALINIKKLPAKATSKDSEIQEAFNKYHEIIKMQIDAFKPNIIIGGNTIKYMLESNSDLDILNLKGINLIDKIEHIEYYPNKDRVIIDAWHPANMNKGLTQEIYCDGIINAAKDWFNNYKDK